MGAVLRGQVVTKEGLLPAAVAFGPHITSVTPGAAPGDRIILPGFIDVHVHGGGGADTMDGAAGVRQLAMFHVKHGTTTIVPTTITNPLDRIFSALAGVAEVRAAADSSLPDIPGAHLEGPFISPRRLGAQPPDQLLPEAQLVAELLATGVLSVVTLAPELPHAAEAARVFTAAGVRVSLGHSAGTDVDALELYRAGTATGATHLFNAMGGIEGRAPGLAGAALTAAGVHAELILDLQHVAATSFRVAHRALGSNLLLVTDAMRATGLGDCESELGGQPVTVSRGRALLHDGTLAGSVLTMDQAVRNARALGCSWEQTAELAAGAAARYLGLGDRGSITPGKRADFVVMDPDARLLEVWVAGRQVA